MALNGSFTSTNGETAQIYTVWRVISQNAAANTSTIETTVYLKYGLINLPAANMLYVKIGGGTPQTVGFGAVTGDGSEIKLKLLGVFTQTLTHNADGYLTVTFDITATAAGPAPIASIIYSASVNRIKRKSELRETWPVIADAAAVYVSYSVFVNEADYTHKIELICAAGSISRTGLKFSALRITSSSYQLTSNEITTLLGYMPSSQTMNATIRVTTYDTTGVSMGYTELPVTVQTSAANSSPTFTSFTYKDTNSVTKSATGDSTGHTLLQKYSFLTVTCAAATAKDGASIVRYSAVIAGISVSVPGTTIIIGYIDTYGTLELSVSATDSRGYTTTLKSYVNILPYERPTLDSFKIHRFNSIEAPIILNFSGKMSSIKPGATEMNSITAIKYRYKKTSAINYGSWISLLASSTIDGLSFSFSSESAFTLDTTFSYHVELYFEDKLGSSSAYTKLATVSNKPIVTVLKEKIGINNFNPQHAFDVGGDIGMNGHIIQGFVRRLATTGEDFNDIIDGGIYMYYLMAADTACTNAPAAHGFLEVFAGTAGYLIMQRFTSSDNAIYVRTRGLSGTWSSWTTI